jgi:hypothetical protein
MRFVFAAREESDLCRATAADAGHDTQRNTVRGSERSWLGDHPMSSTTLFSRTVVCIYKAGLQAARIEIRMNPSPMPSASKPRARLSVDQVLTIFQARASASTATKVATVYGVSEKAVRDIWKGRTWSRETWHLDTSRPLQLKIPGRPKGCRDTKPRARRVNCRYVLSASTGSSTQMHSEPRCFHTDGHAAARHAVEQGAFVDMPPEEDAHWMAGLALSTHSTACFEDSSSAVHRWSAALWTGSTLYCASVDEQLHAWDAFWRDSTSEDPFCDDWNPCCSAGLAP